MASSIDIWSNIKNTEPIGEVFSIDSDYVDIFIYPEFLQWIRVGEILAVETDWGYALCIALSTSYRAQRSFRALKLDMEVIRKNIPDIYKFHVLLTRAVYTSRFENGSIIHMKGGTPLLHALAFKIPDDAIENFLKPKGKLDLSFIRSYIKAGATPEDLKYFINRYYEIISKVDSVDFVRELARILSSIENIDPLRYIKVVSEFMGWI